MKSPINVLITGADGFIGKNLSSRLEENKAKYVVSTITRHTDESTLTNLIRSCSVVVHLAGVNRPLNNAEFQIGNVDFTRDLLDKLEQSNPRPVLFSSSTQALADNPYGHSKIEAERLLDAYTKRTGKETASYRLPNVFGKWCKPDYNSAVATFCHRIAHREEIVVHDATSPISLLYIDDLVDHLIIDIDAVVHDGKPRLEVSPVYKTTVGDLAIEIRGFSRIDQTQDIPRTGEGLTRALYATYLSHLETTDFSFQLTQHSDSRGSFTEFLRTPDAGQFSFFTAKPGITRGGHYHHTKNEKFLVVRGAAKFRFKHIISGEIYELLTDDSEARVVKTIPGWAHDITNIGNEDMIVMLWANEKFDRSRPDTIFSPLQSDIPSR